MLTSKQRAFLRSYASNLNCLMQVGKNGITPFVTKSVDEILNAREIIKINVLENCEMDIKEIAQILSERTHSQIVQIIGHKIILYRKSKQNHKIDLD